jgi:hypothetical protein
MIYRGPGFLAVANKDIFMAMSNEKHGPLPTILHRFLTKMSLILICVLESPRYINKAYTV